MSVMVRRVVIVLVAVVGLVLGGVRTGTAQKPGPGEGPMVGVSFDVSLTVREPSAQDAFAIRLSGRFNVTGEFEMRLDSGGLGVEAELIAVGERIYVRSGSDPWLYVDLGQIRALAETAGAGGRTRPMDSPECMQTFMAFAQRLQQPAELLREIGTFEGARPDAIDGIAVLHYGGTVDLAKLVGVLAPLIENPACTDGEMVSIAELLDELELEGLPSLRYDIYLGQDDGFPYRFRLLLDLDDVTVELLANARPSRTFFDIRAPQGATPLPLGPLPAL
jgi:hypothetical protein